MHRLWYVRRGDKVTGPFPLPAIEQDWLLGRLRPQDELSEDGVHWLRVADQPELTALTQPQPAEATDPDRRDWRQERLDALRRWADQRSGADRREAAPAAILSGRRQGERREEGADARRERDTDRSAPSELPRGAWRIVTAILALLIVILIAIAYHLGTVVPVPVRLG